TQAWFEAARHYGIDAFVSMTPLEEALSIQRDWPGKVQFIAVPRWGENSIDDWLRRVESFYNIGSRIIKFHIAPRTIAARGWRRHPLAGVRHQRPPRRRTRILPPQPRLPLVPHRPADGIRPRLLLTR